MPIIGSGALRSIKRWRWGCRFHSGTRVCCYFHVDFCCPGEESDSEHEMEVGIGGDRSALMESQNSDSSSLEGAPLATSGKKKRKLKKKKSVLARMASFEVEKEALTPLVEPTLMQCGPCTPTVHTTVNKRLVYDARVVLVLIVTSNPEWDGLWAPDPAEMQELYRDIQKLNKKTRSLKSSDHIRLGSILDFVAQNRDRILAMPPSMHGMLNHEIVTDAFEMFDEDGNNVLDLTEWEDFLSMLEVLHRQHLLQLAHQGFRAFYGRGQVGWWPAETRMIDGDHLRAVVDGVRVPFPTFQLGYDPDNVKQNGKPALLPPGWLQDVFYFSANNHPLHGIFACDPSHRLSRVERIMMELAVIAFTFFTNGLKDSWVVHGHAPCEVLEDSTMFGLVVVTLPSMVMFWTLFSLFTCPWGNPDKSKATPDELLKATKITSACEFIGNALVIICFIGLGYRLVRVEMTDFSHLHLRTSLTGRLKSYVITWVTMVCVHFNPFVMWANPNLGGGFCAGDYVGVGQWRAEKQKFQAICKSIVANPHARLSARHGV